jgi:hypothetical protein
VTPLLPIALGLLALGTGVAILRTFGSKFRVGRLLGVAPVVPVAEARALAAGPPRYVAVQGRIDAEDAFEDEAHRPLVLRRVRFETGAGTRWRTVDEQRAAVDFVVREGLDEIRIDHASLDTGLVVIPRESTGVAADAAGRIPEGLPPSAPLRMRIDQVSAIEHATVAGVPTLDPATGEPWMTTGLGRPLILTTLERDEAMRVLASDAPRRPLLAVIAMVIGLVALTLGVAWALLGLATGSALAATPEPSGVVNGDPRSSGQGPGIVGQPLLAIGLMLAIGIGAAILTTLYVRWTGGRRA